MSTKELCTIIISQTILTSQQKQKFLKGDVKFLPDVAFVGAVFDMITQCLKHSTCRCDITAVEYLKQITCYYFIVLIR